MKEQGLEQLLVAEGQLATVGALFQMDSMHGLLQVCGLAQGLWVVQVKVMCMDEIKIIMDCTSHQATSISKVIHKEKEQLFRCLNRQLSILTAEDLEGDLAVGVYQVGTGLSFSILWILQQYGAS